MLFDILSDPGERTDLLKGRGDAGTAERAAALAEELRERLTTVGRPEEALLSAEAREGLEALGYLQ